MSASLTSPTTTFPSRINSLPAKPHLSSSSNILPQYPTPPPTDSNTAPRGKKRKITAPSIDTSASKKSTSTRSPATATPTTGKPSTPSRGRQSSAANAAQNASGAANNYPTRLSSAERNRRHIVSEEKRRKEGELERLRLSRLVPDALDLDRSEEQLLETTVDFVWGLLDDRRKLVEALKDRGIEVGEGEFEGGAGKEIWGDERIMAELGDLEGLKAGTTGLGGGDDDGAENALVDASISERPKPKRRKSKAKGTSSVSAAPNSADPPEQNDNDTAAAMTGATNAETPLPNPNMFDPDIFDLTSYLPPALDDGDDDPEARAAASSLADFTSYG